MSDQLKSLHSNTWIELSKTALKNNIDLFNNLNENPICPVVKSNAYGHGFLEVSQFCLKQGIKILAVNSLAEFLILKKRISSLSAEVLIMGRTAPLPEEQDYNKALLVVGSLDYLEEIISLKMPIKIHLKVDTGLARLGFKTEELEGALKLLKENPQITLSGLMSHFANVEDVTESDYMHAQIKEFNTAKDYLKNQKVLPLETPLLHHISASAAGLLFPVTHFDLIRVGISLYGLWASKITKLSAHSIHKQLPQLKPVLTWKARIAQVKDITPGDCVGYGCTFKSNQNMRVATIPVGYYEGYDRSLGGKSYVLINGERAPLLGRVCMNMMIVDVSHIPKAEAGSIATLIGSDGNNRITADDLAVFADTINYEIVTRINAEIPRVLVD